MKKLVKPKLDIWKLIKLIQDANKKSTSVESKKAQNLQVKILNLTINVLVLEQTPRKVFKQQIKQFQARNIAIQTQEESRSLAQAFLKSKTYFKFAHYDHHLQQNQPQINWIKRAITLNWMMEILTELRSKRQVFALAANYFDRYLTLTENIKLDKLQLIACGALCLANKMQGLTFSINSLCMDGCFDSQQIIEFQQKLATTLSWKLSPPTSNMWANRICQHWDIYTETNPLPPFMNLSTSTLKFRSQDNQGYQNYRTLMQYIDVCILDTHSLRYHNREIAASFIYLIFIVRLGMYDIQEVVTTFASSSQYLIQDNQINLFFGEFLTNSFGFGLKQLLPTIQFCSTFMLLPLNFDLPNGIDQNIQIEYSQLCSLQTWNQENLFAIKQRNRQFD